MKDWRSLDISESHFIRSSRTPGLRLHLRSRDVGNGRPVLFVHGATFSGRLFDIPHEGVNWLAAAAADGLSPYALDIRGYGRSRPDPFPLDAPPYATGDDAVRGIADAVHWIAARHDGAPVALVGWSWGSITTARHVIETGADGIAALVLYAPIFAERNAGWLQLLADPADSGRLSALDAFRRVDLPATRLRWDAQIPAGAEGWRQESVLQALVAASLDDDPDSDATDPPSFLVPNGTFMDLWEAFNAREPYDPARLTCPVMLVRGAQDPTSTRSDALALFDRLGAARRQYVEIANGTHFINAEAQADQLFASVHAFLRNA